jgi:hypothetical protein
MQKASILLGISAVLAACTPQNKPQSPSADTTNSPQAVQQRISKLKLQFEQVIQPDSSDYLLLPLNISETPDEEGFIDIRTYKEHEPTHYWNVAFYNTRMGQHHLLDETRKMLIHQITVNGPVAESYGSKRAGATDNRYIFYRVITADHNGDKRFNFADLTYLFVSDRDGRAFRQLSPAGYDLLSWELVSGTRKVFMPVHRDGNNNHRLDEAEEKLAFLVDLDRPEPAREIFTGPEKTHLKELYDRDWKRIK